MRALGFGSFPCGDGSRNVERVPPVPCMGLLAVKQTCLSQGEAKGSRQLEVTGSRPGSSAHGGAGWELDGYGTLGTLETGLQNEHGWRSKVPSGGLCVCECSS